MPDTKLDGQKAVMAGRQAGQLLRTSSDRDLCPILKKHVGLEVFGMSVVIDDTLPKDWIELRDPNTGEVLGTIINVG